MAVFKINKTKDYTVMSNHHLRDKSLSLKAKGLLSQMLSLPEDWDYTIQGLCSINKENETAINSTLKELKDNGYLIVTKKMPNETKSGRIEYVYDIYETPKQEGKKQDLENLGVEVQVVENQGQSNTDIRITENKVKKEEKKDVTLFIENEIVNYTGNEKLRAMLREFVEYRIQKRERMSERAFKLMLNKLEGFTDEEQMDALETSIISNWAGVFPKHKDRGQSEQKQVGKVAHGNEDYNEDFDMESYMERRRRQG